MNKNFFIPYDPIEDPTAQILHMPLSELPAYEYSDEIPDYYRIRIKLFLTEFFPIKTDYKGGPSFIQSHKTLSQIRQDVNNEAGIHDDNTFSHFHIKIRHNLPARRLGSSWYEYKDSLLSLVTSTYERYFDISPKLGYVNPSRLEYFILVNRTRAYFSGVASDHGIDPALYGKCFRVMVMNGSDRIQQLLGLKVKEKMTGEKSLIATIYDYTDRRYYNVPWDDIQFRLGLLDSQEGE